MSESHREPLEPELLIQPVNVAGPGSPVFRTDDRYAPIAPQPPKRKLALILLLLTVASTFYAGYAQFPVGKPVIDLKNKQVFWVKDEWASMHNGLLYSLGVLSILMAHEMGHYLQARRYGVPASLPLFIPMPVSPLGTMGAVIVQQAGTADRKSMFDIAISGPLAGLVVALPLNWWGIQHSHIGQMAPGQGGYTNPLIVEWMIGLIHHPLKPGEDILLTPIVFAGWVGIFITGFNLIPIGQLDGGHILYCLIGKRAHFIARWLYFAAAATVVINVIRGNNEYSGWFLMLALLWMMGTRHPPTANDRVPLGAFRIVLGWLTLLFILVGFVPAPMYQTPVPARPAIQRDPAKEVQV